MMIRFHVKNAEGGLLESTDWEDDRGHQMAVERVEALRKVYGPDALISVERQGAPEIKEPSLFRYDIFIDNGAVVVIDEEGTHSRKVKNFAFHSRPYQAAEREQVLAMIRAQYPDARLTEVKLRG